VRINAITTRTAPVNKEHKNILRIAQNLPGSYTVGLGRRPMPSV